MFVRACFFCLVVEKVFLRITKMLMSPWSKWLHGDINFQSAFMVTLNFNMLS